MVVVRQRDQNKKYEKFATVASFLKRFDLFQDILLDRAESCRIFPLLGRALGIDEPFFLFWKKLLDVRKKNKQKSKNVTCLQKLG